MIIEKVNVPLGLVNNMLYTFGDSITYGADLVKAGFTDDQRKNITWPGILADMLNQPLTDLSFPASSSWRIARQIQNLNLTKDDYVFIQWTTPHRFEFGVSNEYDYQSSIPETIFRMVDSIHNDGVRTKDMCHSLIYHTSDTVCKNMMKTAYSKMFNEEWYHQMFRVMVQSSLYVLDKSGCKYIMFDGWMKNCDDQYFQDVPNYVFRGTTISNHCRKIAGADRPSNEYATKDEHRLTAEAAYYEFKRIYRI